MSSPSRRDFLATSSLALAGTMIGSMASARRLGAMPLPRDVASSPMAPWTYMPEPMAPLNLRQLATSGVEAARAAGADYVDVRVNERHSLHVGLDLNAIGPPSDLIVWFTYGVRVLVNGAWAFSYGAAPSADAIATAARGAVATARGYAKLVKHRVELAPAPVVQGEWETPMQLDPFTVPLRDQMALLMAYMSAASRVPGAGADGSFRWSRDARAFASSEGTLVSQILRRSDPHLFILGDSGRGQVMCKMPNIGSAAGGYETMAIAGLQDDIKREAENVAEISRLPSKPFDVGRYPIVLDGISTGSAFGMTIGGALELDRVLGYEADASGTSFLGPAEETLGTQIVSPLTSVTGHRAAPTANAVKWDEEGVEAHAFPLIDKGVLVDYCTTRQTAMALRSWYTKQGMPLRSHGCASTNETDDPVLVRAPHLAMAPSSTSATVTDLCQQVKRGVFLRGAQQFSSDQQLSTGSLHYLAGCVMLEIDRGKIVNRIEGSGLQFNARQFWKNVLAVGGKNTVLTTDYFMSKGQPWRTRGLTASAPATLLKEINVVSTRVAL